MRFETKAIHAGREIDPTTGAVTAPIHLSTTYERSADGSYTDGFMYSRGDNPNRRSLEDCLTSLENGYDCVTYASGMAAISSVIESLPEEKPKRIVMADDMYFGVRTMLMGTDIGRKIGRASCRERVWSSVVALRIGRKDRGAVRTREW